MANPFFKIGPSLQQPALKQLTAGATVGLAKKQQLI
jgi:hypothetical protein